jgi:hypothetical protein
MYVNNDTAAPISEADIANRYNLAFPQLSIKVKNV